MTVVPSGIGVAGVTTSLSAGQGNPFCVLFPTCGEHAGGFGLVTLTGLELETWWASGSGSLSPLGSPGYVGCTNVNVAGWPLTVTEFTVMFGPVPPAVWPFVRSKSKLRSVRHCVDFTCRSTWFPGRNMFVGVS